MPSSHNRGTVIRTETTPARSTSGLEDTRCAPSQEPTLPPFFTTRTGRISCAALLTRHKETLEKHSWERSTLQCLSTQKKMPPFSTTTTTELHLLLHSVPSKSRSFLVQVDTSIKSLKEAVTSTKRPDYSSSDLETMATQSTTIRCRNGGEAEFHHPPDSQKCHAFLRSRAGAPFRQVGVPILGHFLPGQLVYIVQDFLVLPLIHHHEERRRDTTEDHHLIGGAPLGSKNHDPFHLRDLSTRPSSVQNVLGFVGPNHLACCAMSKSSSKSFVKLRDLASLFCNICHSLSMTCRITTVPLQRLWPGPPPDVSACLPEEHELHLPHFFLCAVV